jgi:hypothetical protein
MHPAEIALWVFLIFACVFSAIFFPVYFAFANKATTTVGSTAAPNKATTAAGPTAAAGQATTTAGSTAAAGQATTTAGSTAAAGQATTTAGSTAPNKATTAAGPTAAAGQAIATFLPMTYVEDWDVTQYGCTDKRMAYYTNASSTDFERQQHQLMQDHCNSSDECKGYYQFRIGDLLSATHTPKKCAGPMKMDTTTRFWKKGGPCTPQLQAGVSTRADRTPCSVPIN